jgi:hypothetical protein
MPSTRRFRTDGRPSRAGRMRVVEVDGLSGVASADSRAGSAAELDESVTLLTDWSLEY